MTFLKKRAATLCAIDTPNITYADLATAHASFTRAERHFGGHRIVIGFLSALTRRWGRGRPFALLDMYCGVGDLSAAIARWGKQSGTPVEILAVDRAGHTIDMARERHRDVDGLTFDVRDAGSPLFLEAHQFDCVVSAQSLHRLTADEETPFLQVVNRQARHGFIVLDWMRGLRAAALAQTLTVLSKNPIVRQELPLAIRRSLTLPEARDLARRAGLSHAAVESHGGLRLSLSCDRTPELCRSFKTAPAPG